MRVITIVFVVSAILVVLVIGFIRIRRVYLALLEKRNFADEYLSKFQAFVNHLDTTGELDGELYYWLTHRVSKIQKQLGRLGIMNYTAPFGRYTVNNYQIIINTLPEIRSGIAHRSMIDSCQETLVRYIGHTDDGLEEMAKQVRNPFAWLREGVQTIVLLPILFISAMGIIGSSAVNTIEQSCLFKIIVALITIITLVSSIVTVVVGWDQSINILKNWF